jgi:Fe2+ transport system protein FeoA
LNLAEAKMGKYIVLSIKGGERTKRLLANLHIKKGTNLTKRGICPKHDPVKVDILGVMYIQVIPRKLATRVIVNYSN